jgi:hypothetical protein
LTANGQWASPQPESSGSEQTNYPAGILSPNNNTLYYPNNYVSNGYYPLSAYMQTSAVYNPPASTGFENGTYFNGEPISGSPQSQTDYSFASLESLNNSANANANYVGPQTGLFNQAIPASGILPQETTLLQGQLSGGTLNNNSILFDSQPTFPAESPLAPMPANQGVVASVLSGIVNYFLTTF